VAEPKPSHLSADYGAWFKDPLLVAAYPAILYVLSDPLG
jgi:hypothetical protein